ncbi:Tryptophan synthase beta chain 2, chloroplastic [Dendrobium catenatum]|uniref:Tryptophan synthase beta chain 2, chloroplastic n=1 Tax=Dendrobium catenatum TaxID=906689 RepID=A0A2I0VH84_9ASPA|nr:Tryptophan synthase beta chain 2, chloroplastic [Dendrobium catenatum]
MAAVAASTANTTIRKPRINPLFYSSKSSYSSSPTRVSFLQARSGTGSHLLATVARREVSATAMAIEEIGNGAVGLAAQRPDSFGRFGRFGGKYVPETLMHALTELESAFRSLSKDQEFQVVIDIVYAYFLISVLYFCGGLDSISRV